MYLERTAVHPEEAFALEYGRLLAELQMRRQAIGTMDLLIATAAVMESAPVLTRNVVEFERRPGLLVVSY